MGPSDGEGGAGPGRRSAVKTQSFAAFASFCANCSCSQLERGRQANGGCRFQQPPCV